MITGNEVGFRHDVSVCISMTLPGKNNIRLVKLKKTIMRKNKGFQVTGWEVNTAPNIYWTCPLQ